MTNQNTSPGRTARPKHMLLSSFTVMELDAAFADSIALRQSGLKGNWQALVDISEIAREAIQNELLLRAPVSEGSK